MGKIIKLIKESYAGIFISLCLSFMLFFYEPLNIFAFNLEDFWFDIYTFFPIVLFQFFLIFIILSILFIVLNLLNKKIYYFFLVCFFIGTVCFYIQGNLLSYSLPIINGDWVDFDKFGTEKIISYILWISVAVITLVGLWKFKIKKIEKITFYISLLIIVMLSSSFLAIFSKEGFFEKKKYLIASNENYNEMSSNKNVIFFLVDAVDSKTFYNELEKLGNKEELFKNFTYFPDTLGGYPFTRNSIPLILSGKWYENKEDYGEYLNDVYDNSSLFKELENNNYDINIYEEELNKYSGDNYKRFKNLKINAEVDITSLIKEELKVILYKYLPYQLKWIAKADTLDMRNAVKDIDEKYFSKNNITNYKKITEEDFEIVDKNNFKFIHLEGAHAPFRYDKDLNIVKGSYESNVDSCITIIEAYINKLKSNNLYDNTAIIVLSDHGFNEEEIKRQNPILFIKGFDEHHDYNETDKKVSYEDLVDASIDLINGKKSNQLFNEDNEIRRFLLYYVDNHMYEYELEGNAWDSTALKKTGKEFILE